MFDPDLYEMTTRTQWQDAAEAWHRWGHGFVGPGEMLVVSAIRCGGRR